MPRPEQDGLKGGAHTHEQGPDPLGGIALVAGQGQQVHAEGRDIDRQLADGLRRIGVEQGAVAPGQCRQLRDGSECANLVIGVHHRNQGGVVAQGRRERGGRDPPVPVDRKHRDLPA